MEPHSLVLLSGSTLDACQHVHHNQLHSTPARRAQPVPLHSGPRRPLRNIAESFARLLPQLRQLSRRLRWTGTPSGASIPAVRTWNAAADSEPSTSAPAYSIAPTPHAQHYRRPRWHAPRWRRAQRTQLPGHIAAQQHDAQLPHQQLSALPEDAQQPELEARKQDQLQLQELEPQQQLQHHQQHHLLTHHHHHHVPLAQRRRAPLRRLGRVLRFLRSNLRPQGPGDHDKNVPERILNVATCGMFFQAGSQIVRLCRSLAARRFGWAFVAVGAIATIYHGSWGRFRCTARKVDYYAIAASSLLLRSALVGPVPRWLTGAMLALLPFKPTLISGSNFMAVEVRYLLLALSQRRLLAAWAAHTGMSLTAIACFTMEETPLLSWFPYTHAAFHVLSAAAFLTLPSAMNHLTEALPAVVGVAA